MPAPRQPESHWPTAAVAAQALAAEVAAALRIGIRRRGVATLVVCGGRTPVPFLRALAQQPLEWPQVFITQTDERWVPRSDARSNTRLLRRHLLRGRAHGAMLVSLRTHADSVHQGRRMAAAQVGALPQPWDAVVLGMGDDGHFASLFPGGRGLEEQLRPYGARGVVVTRAPVPPYARLSLTLASLLNARRVWLLIEGRNKAEVYARARDAQVRHPVPELPVTALLQQDRTPVPVWLIATS